MRRVVRLMVVCVLLAAGLVVMPAVPVAAAGVVGDGTVASCMGTTGETALETALAGGGAVSFDCGPDPVTLTVTSQKTINANTQIDGGGLVTLSGGNATRIFSVNSGITLELSNITLSDGNAGLGDGGAIFNDGILTITNSALSGNEAGDDGGAIFNDGILAITTSTLSSNGAGGDGGAIFNDDGTLTITTSTLSSNEAESVGGAIFNNISSSLTIISSTLNGNQSSLGGAIYNNLGGDVDLQTSILANSTGSNCHNNFGAITSLGYNLSDDDSCNLSAVTNDLPNTEPLLADLDDYGGPTQTHLPLPTSPAINAIPLASCAIDDQGAILPDQRGIARPQNGLCDIGSVEVRANQPPSTTRVTATPNPVDEGSNTTISITASDPADDDDGGVLSYAFDCDGNGSFEVGPQPGNETMCSYPDDGVVVVTGRVSDSGGLSDTDSVEVTVSNAAPAIDPLTATIDGDQIVVAVQASDPAGANDPLTYAFDCDNSGDIDIGPQDANTARCPLDVLGGSQVIRVVVSDDDGGMTEGFASVAVDYGLCAGWLSGLLREAGETGCARGELALSLPGDGPLAVCVGWVGGFMRAAGDCAWSEYALSLPEDGPLTICVNPLSWLLRVPSGACAWYETERVIGDR